MKILFKNITLMYENGAVKPNMYVVVKDEKIESIGEAYPEGTYDRVITGENKLLCPGFYNCHTHTPMTIFRGYAENLPLSRWLHEKIFPAEDRLYPEAVSVASTLSMAEMMRNGTVSFSDMYFFCEDIIEATAACGMKANVSRSTVAFDPAITAETDDRFKEAVKLYESYHNFADGRIKMDMSIHAEYSTVPASCRYISDFALEKGLSMHIHLSETKAEHEACIAKYGVTPTEFFEQNGVFRVPVIAAHCVHLTDNDMKIMAKNGATAVHNPASNLKLGSGIARLENMLRENINVTLGTDGAASNNTLDVMKEAYLASILQKGSTGRTDSVPSAAFIEMLTQNGAKMQGRADCGKLAAGARADLVMLDFDMVHVMPVYDYCDAFLYSANSSNVVMTMVDGKILYENGEYRTIDIEKMKYRFRKITENYFK
jgi:5-methylthioadenosine/S-adenosylhomocysteine deaminase